MKTRTLLAVVVAIALASCSSPSERYLPCELPPFGCPDLVVEGPEDWGWDETCAAGVPLGMVVPIDDDDLPEP